ncbi:serine protease, partial [Lunasporangiospora selenospora]
MLMKLSTIAAIILASSTTVAAFPSCVQSETLAPVISSFDAEVVPDQYFVVFKEGSRAWEYSSWIRELHESDLSARGILHESFDGFEGGIRHVYDMGPFQGLAGRFSPEVLEQIRRHPE